MEGLHLTIIGRGAFGSALASVYQRAGASVQLLGRERWPEDFGSSTFVAVPTIDLNSVLGRLAAYNHQLKAMILCCKGIEASSGLLPTQIAAQFLPDVSTYVLSGPGFAKDLEAGRPVAHTLAHSKNAAALAKMLSTPTFRLYHCDDGVGVQLCGALKNIIAIAAGVAQGLSLGESARAALITRATVELRYLLKQLGGRPETQWTLAGIGDLILTCNSPTSRNFRFGEAIAKGTTVQHALGEIGTVEGLGALAGLAQLTAFDQAPICQGLSDVLHKGQDPRGVVERWMTQRPSKAG